MDNLLNLIDELINEHYVNHNKYPAKIIMNQLTYDKLMSICRDQDIAGCWIAKEEKNYKGVLINITEFDEIKLE